MSIEMFCRLSIPVGQDSVVSAVGIVVFECHKSAGIAAIPSDCAGESAEVACHWRTVGAAQVAVEPVVAAEQIVGSRIYELRAAQAAVGVVVYGGIWPVVSEFAHIAQIYGVVDVSVNFISAVVQVVERCAVKCAKRQSEN